MLCALIYFYFCYWGGTGTNEDIGEVWKTWKQMFFVEQISSNDASEATFLCSQLFNICYFGNVILNKIILSFKSNHLINACVNFLWKLYKLNIQAMNIIWFSFIQYSLWLIINIYSNTVFRESFIMSTKSVISICLVLLSLSLYECSVSEKTLVRTLLEDYEPLARPVNDSRIPVTLAIIVTLKQIVDLDERNQILKTNIWLEYYWNDTNLTWNPVHSNLNDIISNYNQYLQVYFKYVNFIYFRKNTTI